MNIESSSKIWAVLFTSIILGIVAYFGYKFYFPKEEVLVLDEVIAPSPTPAPFRWDLYLDAEDATAEAKESTPSAQLNKNTTKGDVEEVKKSSSTTTTTKPSVTETTITTSTSTNNNGEKTSETKTYTTTSDSYVIEVKAEAHASAEVK